MFKTNQFFVPLLTVVMCCLFAFTACNQNEEAFGDGVEYIKYLHEQEVEPFGEMSEEAYEYLLSAAVFDDDFKFRGMTDIRTLKSELGDDKFDFLLDKIARNVKSDLTFGEYKK